MATFAYKVMYRGEVTAEGLATHQPYATANKFAAEFGALLDTNPDSPPLPHPVELRVWAGEDTDRDPDAVHVRRRRVRGRELTAVGS